MKATHRLNISVKLIPTIGDESSTEIRDKQKADIFTTCLENIFAPKKQLEEINQLEVLQEIHKIELVIHKEGTKDIKEI